MSSPNGSPVSRVAIAVEATTGWRYVVEEIKRAGIEPHLAEPAETKSLQGRKKRAKTDRLDAGHLRDFMVIERLPESWIPPDHIQEIRTLMRLRHSLIEERTTHKQRIHAQLFHNGYPRQKQSGLYRGSRLPGGYGASDCGPEGSGPVFGDDRPHKRGARAHRKGAAGLRSTPRPAVRRSWLTTASGSLPAWRCFRSSAIPDASRVRRRRYVMPGWTSPFIVPTTGGRRASSAGRVRRY